MQDSMYSIPQKSPKIGFYVPYIYGPIKDASVSQKPPPAGLVTSGQEELSLLKIFTAVVSPSVWQMKSHIHLSMLQKSHATLMMPGRVLPCFCGGKPQEQPKKTIIKFIWAT